MNENTKRILDMPVIEQKTKEWYNQRYNMITASDIAAILNISPFMTRKRLLRDKTKPFDKIKKVDNFLTRHGNKYEGEALKKYEQTYNEKCYETGLYQHSKYKWLGASPDGITCKGKLVEIKCPLKREIKHEIPEYYYPQVQIQLEVCDIEECLFIQYKPSINETECEFDVLEIKRNREWFKETLPILESFWEEVLHNREVKKDVTIDMTQLELCRKIPRNYLFED
jgi:putative phage-type endonuclease